MPSTGQLVTGAVIVNTAVGITLAIDPPWSLWQSVGLAVVLGLAATVLLYRLTRKP